MKVLAIDPGNTKSAYVLMDGYKPLEFGILENDELRQKMSIMSVTQTMLAYGTPESEVDKVHVHTAIEMVASYGMPVGREVFDTCVWVGRFWENAPRRDVTLIYRMEEKMTLCHDSKAKDSNIRQALIDRFAEFDKKNGKGTKDHPDWFYGFSADVWSAYAVGVTFLDKQQEQILQR